MKAVKKKLWTGWIRIQKILTEKDGISTVELNSGNSSTNENFKEMLKTLYFQ